MSLPIHEHGMAFHVFASSQGSILCEFDMTEGFRNLAREVGQSVLLDQQGNKN